jgi:hypothetical protein
LKNGDIVGAGSAQFFFWLKTPEKHDDAEVPTPTGHLVDARRRSAYALDRLSTGIGRDESNSLIVENPSASRFHAEIRREAGGFALRTMGVTGTKVNGKAISSPVLLSEGDEIQIADLLLRYTAGALPAGVKLATPDDVAPLVEAETVPIRHIPAPTPLAVRAVPLETVRNPMRFLALVSSLLAAVAIATLLLMHRGP